MGFVAVVLVAGALFGGVWVLVAELKRHNTLLEMQTEMFAQALNVAFGYKRPEPEPPTLAPMPAAWQTVPPPAPAAPPTIEQNAAFFAKRG